MCGGLEYEVLESKGADPATLKPGIRKVFFPIPHARVPVLTESGVEYLQWGKRQHEDPEFDVPVTGWARLLSLKEGKWNRYQPQRVKIPAERWMEKDSAKASHWFDMEAESYLLGVRINVQREDEERSFVYIVTRPADEAFSAIHQRMPMVTR